jgi:nucleoside-diphosphate-sugar epimerase
VAGGHEVVILKRSFSDCCRIADLLTELIHFDLDQVPLAEVFAEVPGISAIIHTATCYGRRDETFSEIFGSNTAFPLQFLELAVAAGVATFVNTDTSLDRFLNPYALSKRQFAEWGRFYADKKMIRFVNLELEHFYGAGDDESKFTTHVICSCVNNLPELKLTLGEQRRDFIHIDDVLTAYLIVLGEAQHPSAYFQVYGVGSGKSVTIRSFVESVQQLANSHTRLNFGALPYRENEVMDTCADVTALKALGWSQKVSLAEGIKRTIIAERAKGSNS